MRVIAGSAKSIKLKTVEGMDTRPTTDRIKETLFNMIHFAVPGCNFLDLFSGSGAIGIEALSRGGNQAVFVESSNQAIRCINHNLRTTKLEANAMVLKMDVLSSIKELDKQDMKFDIVFMDPPYNQLIEKDILLAIFNSNILKDNSIIIVEAAIHTEFDYLNTSNFHIYKEKVYKTNKHVFMKTL